jgi:phosphatidylserine/phosphatidylglycerophosphate/cardiolipin synthase-like enzyme
MTRKKTSDTSRSKERKTRMRRRSSSSKPQQARLNQYITIALMLGAVILAGYFFMTGKDPLGLFVEATPTPKFAPPAFVGSGGDWWHVYFTDPRPESTSELLTGSVAEKLIDQVNNAQRAIHIAAFEFDLAPVAESLIAAHERGVEVGWITDDEYGIEIDEEEGAGLFARLEDAGITVKDDGRTGLMHNKFWIFDGETVWTGSTNITANGNLRNNNNAIVIDSPQVAAIFEREFAEMWDGAFGPTSPSTVDQQMVTVDGTPITVLFAPEDEVLGHLIPLVESAQYNIRFMAFSFTHDGLSEAMLNRVKAGVDVKGIFETRGSETEFSEMSRLYCAKVPVRQDGNPRTFHHKVIVIDDKLVVTGSLNFSEAADESNDENVVIIGNTDIAAQYLSEFQRRWAEANELSPADVACE